MLNWRCLQTPRRREVHDRQVFGASQVSAAPSQSGGLEGAQPSPLVQGQDVCSTHTLLVSRVPTGATGKCLTSGPGHLIPPRGLGSVWAGGGGPERLCCPWSPGLTPPRQLLHHRRHS